jgi:hypothetical protein
MHPGEATVKYKLRSVVQCKIQRAEISARRDHQSKSLDAKRLSSAAPDRGTIHDHGPEDSDLRLAHDHRTGVSGASRAIDTARVDPRLRTSGRVPSKRRLMARSLDR